MSRYIEGEDLLAGERRKLQVAQQAAWCAVQTAEKSALKAHELAAQNAYAELTMQQEAYQNAVARAQNDARLDLQRTIANDNFRLADEKKAREVWSGKCLSPCHRISLDTRNEGSKFCGLPGGQYQLVPSARRPRRESPRRPMQRSRRTWRG